MWQSPSNSRTRNVIPRRGAHPERPAEKFLIFRFLSAKRFHLADILCEIGIFPRALKMSAPTRYDEKHLESRWRFPHQSADWFGMTRCSGAVLSSANSNLAHRRTTPSGSGKERSQTRYVTTCQRRLAAKFQFFVPLSTAASPEPGHPVLPEKRKTVISAR